MAAIRASEGMNYPAAKAGRFRRERRSPARKGLTSWSYGLTGAYDLVSIAIIGKRREISDGSKGRKDRFGASAMHDGPGRDRSSPRSAGADHRSRREANAWCASYCADGMVAADGPNRRVDRASRSE